MRYVSIDLSSDNYLQQPKIFGGYSGEHNETVLQVKLPSRMIGIECSGYRFDFQTSEDNKISSPLIPISELNDDVLSFHLVEQLTIAGNLLFNVVAILSNETTVSLVSKTNTVVLCIEDSPEGNVQLADPNGYKDELQKMIDERIMEINPAKVDQTYTPTSSNAQSGIATAEAVGVANDYTDMAIKSLKTYANNTFAPAIKNTVSGSELVVQAVSPVEHDLDVSVRSKNLITPSNFTQGKYNFSTEDIIGENVELSGYTVNGTDLQFDADIKAGETYTLSVSVKAPDNGENIKERVLGFDIYDTDNATWRYTDSSTDTFYKFNTYSNAPLDATQFVKYSRTFKAPCNSNKLRLILRWYSRYVILEWGSWQLEKGSTATDYTSYISDFSGVTVTRCGKNFVDMQKFLDRGYELLEDGSYYKSISNAAFIIWKNTTGYTGNIYVSGSFKWSSIKADGTASTYIGSVFLITYTDGSRWYIQPWSAYDTWNILQKTEVNQRFAADGVYVKSIEHAYGTEATPSYVKDLMITLSEDSEFEEYKGEAYTSTSDGTVEGITSLSPNLTLMTDTKGVVIDMTYNADTKMYIDNKFAELQALILEG